MQDTVIATLELALQPELVADFCEQLPEALKETRAFPGFVDISIRHNAEKSRSRHLHRGMGVAGRHETYIAFRTESGMLDQMAAMLTKPPRTEYWGLNIV